MNIQSFVRRALLAVISGVAAGAAPSGFANTVSLVPTGFANGYQAFNVNVATVVDPNALATGAFAGTLDLNPIVFFCFELSQSFSFGPTYTYQDANLSDTDPVRATELSELFTEGFSPRSPPLQVPPRSSWQCGRSSKRRRPAA